MVAIRCLQELLCLYTQTQTVSISVTIMHPLIHSLTHCHIHALKHILMCTLTRTCTYHIISFIFILWIRTGLKIHVDMEIVIHKNTHILLRVFTQSHILSHIHIPLTHTFFLSNMYSGNFNGKTHQLRAES